MRCQNNDNGNNNNNNNNNNSNIQIIKGRQWSVLISLIYRHLRLLGVLIGFSDQNILTDNDSVLASYLDS